MHFQILLEVEQQVIEQVLIVVVVRVVEYAYTCTPTENVAVVRYTQTVHLKIKLDKLT